ncbi:MAG: Crp/Fnr family transcriptional regulator [Bdellovibrionales bacterium]|nr:Crp/Fnr family transcriptional regulator [Bdellovibrionales bacterium]
MNSELMQYGVLPELCALKLFSEFSELEVKSLCQGGKVIVNDHRKVLFKAGSKADFFFVILSGAFKLVRQTLQGDDAIIHFSGPGDVLGALILTQRNPLYPISAISMGPSRALKIPKANYSCWKDNPTLVFRIQNLLSNRMVSLQQQKVLNKSSLQAKMANLLIELAELQSTNSQQTIPIPLTRKEIADTVGASVESIIRIMSDWSKKGYVVTNDKQITILKSSKLIEFMGAEI